MAGVIQTIAPLIEPVTTSEIKLHVREDLDDNNDLLDSLVTAARLLSETFTGRVFIDQTWQLTLDAFPPGVDPFFLPFNPSASESEIIRLPKLPVDSITSIQFIDLDGVTQTLAASKFQLDSNREPARLAPAFQEVWPDTRDVFNAVTILFVAGFGTTAAEVPQSIRSAIKIMVGSWYENREHIIVKGTPKELPFAAKSLLWHDRQLQIL